MSDTTGEPLFNTRLAILSLAGFWALTQLVFALFLYNNEISIRSNILSLLSQSDLDNPGTLQLGSAHLESRSKVLRFAIVADSESQALAAASLLEEKLKTIAQIAVSKISNERVLQKNLLSLLSPHKASLLSPEQLDKLNNNPQDIIQELTQKLYSPLASFYSSFLSADPLLLLPELLLSLNSNSTANVQRGFLLNNLESGRVSASLIAELLKENMSIEEQGTLVAEIDAQLKEVETKFSNTKARWSAMLAFAHSSASRLKQDIMLLSTLGSVFVVGLLVYCFRSPLCLFFCALSVFSGILCGTFMVVFFTGGIHLITLGIGISLMGACIDYSLHFLSECFFSSTPGTKVCALSARNKVCRPILLGALTSVLAFLALKLSSFPGLQELALFALGSIIASSTTVLVWLPLLVRGKCIAPPRIFNKAQCGLLTLGKYVRTIPFPVLAIVMVLFSSTLFLLTTNDDIRALQTPDKQLIDNEIWIQNSGGFPNPSGYLIAGDSDKQKLLETLYYAHYRLEELKESEIIGGFQSVYGLVPPRKIQLDNQQAYQKFVNDNKSALNSAFVALGYPEYMQEKVYQPTPATPLDLDMLLSLLPGKSLGLSRHLSDNETGIYYSGAIPVFDLHNLQALEQAIESMPGLKFFKPADDISSQFISYRSESCLLVGISYLLILAFLYFRYGKSGLVRSAIALVGSILGTFVVLALVGQSISFFSVLAVILVLGLGVDFSIFALEDIGKDPKGDSSAVSIAILLAAASTVVSFGLLAMSSTAVLHSIGIIVSVGVLLCVVICLSIWR